MDATPYPYLGLYNLADRRSVTKVASQHGIRVLSSAPLRNGPRDSRLRARSVGSDLPGICCGHVGKLRNGARSFQAPCICHPISDSKTDHPSLSRSRFHYISHCYALCRSHSTYSYLNIYKPCISSITFCPILSILSSCVLPQTLSARSSSFLSSSLKIPALASAS